MERLLFITREEGWKSEHIHLLVRKSLILSRMGHQARSMDTLEQALALAEPDQYIRTFLDEGVPLLKLLTQYLDLRSQRRQHAGEVSLAYVRLLIQLMSNQAQEAELIEFALDKLTVSERKVLDMIVIGLSNQEIAAKMGVSLSTVKTHINNMYRKLHVSNRKMIIRWADSRQLQDAFLPEKTFSG